MRIADTARGCLLNMGQWEDPAAQAAADASSKRMGATQAVAAAKAMQSGAADADAALEGQPAEKQYLFDVFLSYKRTDAEVILGTLGILGTLFTPPLPPAPPPPPLSPLSRTHTY